MNSRSPRGPDIVWFVSLYASSLPARWPSSRSGRYWRLADRSRTFYYPTFHIFPRPVGAVAWVIMAFAFSATKVDTDTLSYLGYMHRNYSFSMFSYKKIRETKPYLQLQRCRTRSLYKVLLHLQICHPIRTYTFAGKHASVHFVISSIAKDRSG